MFVSDQLHRQLSLEKTPRRIVSLVPSQTEFLVDLGLEKQLVGITKFCVHPAHLRKQIEVVGGTKNVHFNKIKTLAPEIIICNKEENSKEIVEACEKIAPTWVSVIKTIADCFKMMRGLATIFGKETEAEKIIQDISEKQSQFTKNISYRKQRKTLYLIWKNPYMAAGRDSFINSLLLLNHLDNVMPLESRYPEIEEKQWQEAEVILLSSEPYPFKTNDVDELQEKFPQKKILLADGEYFSWYGSRLQKAFDYFQTLDF